MIPSSPLANQPLSDEEFEELSELLDEHSPFNYDGLLGLLHAMALAPGRVPPSSWLPAVFPDLPASSDSVTTERSVGWVLRQYNDIVDALEHQQAILPDEEDVDGCESFAAGYAAGAELDSEWREDADRWTFASGMAYLGGRLDLLTPSDIRDIELNLAPAPKEILRQHLAATIRATYDTFRRDAAAPSASIAQRATSASGRSVRRNDPCPCGSGKKYKRCCIASGSAAG